MPISEKVSRALEAGCKDNACLAVFATMVPLLSPQFQENILIVLLNFKYKWISQYISRIFYWGDTNSDKLLLAYIENLNSYQDVAFLRELSGFLFVFAKEQSLRQYCFLRVMDIILATVAIIMLWRYIILFIFPEQLFLTFDSSSYTIRVLSPLSRIAIEEMKILVLIITIILVVWFFMSKLIFEHNTSILHLILCILFVIASFVSGLAMSDHFTLFILCILIGICKLPKIVTLKLIFFRAKKYLEFISFFNNWTFGDTIKACVCLF